MGAPIPSLPPNPQVYADPPKDDLDLVAGSKRPHPKSPEDPERYAKNLKVEAAAAEAAPVGRIESFRKNLSTALVDLLAEEHRSKGHAELFSFDEITQDILAATQEACRKAFEMMLSKLPQETYTTLLGFSRHPPTFRKDVAAYNSLLKQEKNCYGAELYDRMIDIHLSRHPLPVGIARDTMPPQMQLAAFRAEFFPLAKLHFKGALPEKCTPQMLIKGVKEELSDIDEYGLDTINNLVADPAGKWCFADKLKAFKPIVAKSACYFFFAVNNPGINAILLNCRSSTDEQFLETYSHIQKYLAENDVNVTQIRTGSKNICVIPKEIEKIPSLERLNLNNSNVRYLPNSFCNLRNLSILSLTDTPLQQLPNNFEDLTALTQLGLNNTQLRQLPESFCNLSSLTVLNLKGTPLQQLPERFGNLTALTRLELASTQLQQLPDSFCNLTALTQLGFLNTPLRQLPDNIGNLTALIRLVLNNTPLQQLPESFGNLIALSELNLTGTQLRLLPESFSKLAALTQLGLFNTPLQRLPNNFEDLTALTTLILRNTPIRLLPDNFGNLTALTQLDLGKTQLQRLPERFGNLIALTTLELNNTQLLRLPESFGNLIALTQLGLLNTPIGQLPDNIGNLTALTQLNLNGTPLKLLPASFTHLSNLDRLKVRIDPGVDRTNLPPQLIGQI